MIERIQQGDELIVEGRLNRIQEMNNWGQLLSASIHSGENVLLGFGMVVAEVQLPADCPRLDKTLSELGFRSRYGLNVLEVLRVDRKISQNVKSQQLRAGDVLVVSGMSDLVAVLLMQGLEAVFDRDQEGVEDVSILENDRVGLMEVILSPYSVLSGQTLQDLSFREKFGLTVSVFHHIR